MWERGGIPLGALGELAQLVEHLLCTQGVSGSSPLFSIGSNSYDPLLHMKTYTVEEFQERWDEMIDRVENGEHIGITNGKNTAVMIPAEEHYIAIHSTLNDDAS